MGKSKTPGDIEAAAHQVAARPQARPCPPPPKSWFPWLVPVFFMANVATFVYSMYVNNCPEKTGADRCVFNSYLGRFSFQPLSENPLFGPSPTTLEKLGALEKKLVVQEGEEWRLVSCIWLHAGAIHLIANMLSLLFIGVKLEQEFGFLRIGLLYVISGFGGSLLSALHLQKSISVGASGALFGLLGAMLSELFMNWTIYANKCAALMTLMFVVVLNLAVGFLPHVDSSAHIGGFLSGFLLGFILLVRPQYGYVSRKYIPPGYDGKRVKSKHKWYQYLLWVAALVALIFG
ncbi:unnamed protein product, partial [Vitis vinifera]|uniref:RHOMBOID-like protein n=3 Tax=Vitis vinifera TaxID=29760 RepID=D7U106_VITVI